MKNNALLASIAAWLIASTATPLRAAEPKIEETVVGPANAGGVYTVSQRGANVTFASTKGSRLVVIANGVEGPLFDELFNSAGASFFSPPTASISPATSGGLQSNSVSTVIVSANGEHYAYAGRQGTEYVVIHDGKEIGRGPRQALSLNYGNLNISPGGKFVTWGEMQQPGAGKNATWRLVINGKPGPWSGHHNWVPVFSPDDMRYAYNAVSVEDKEKQSLIVDGKVAGYFGYTPMFTADSKVLLTLAPGNVLLVDGKPASLTGISLEKVTPAPVGRKFAVIMRRKLVNNQAVGVLYLDGKEVPGTEGAQSISFSPDGKRYALSCINAEARSAFMVIDGKKGTEYQSVAEGKYVGWTPDSSKVFYTATTGGRQFVIADGQEIAVTSVNLRGNSPVVTPEKGNRYAFTTADGSNRNFTVVVDGKEVLPAGLWPQSSTLTFSADGSRYAYVVNPIARNEIAGIVVDGMLSNELAVSSFGHGSWINPTRNPYFAFSPNGKYLARMARKPDNSNAGLYINDKMAHPTTYGIVHAEFTPDGQHLFWLGREKHPDRGPLYNIVYVDGQAVAKLADDTFQTTKGAWDVDDKGVLTFIGVIDNVVKRYRVTPAADMNIDKMITQAEQKQATALAEAAVAKKKAEDEALAVAAKKRADAEAAAAKAKADAEAYAAKRKADAEAKAQARLDALAARKKAAEDAAAAKAAARQKK